MNKLMQSFSLISFFACLATAPVHAAELNMEPGMWKWTSTMEMQGMQFPIPPMIYSNCVTKQDLIPKPPEDDQACKMLDKKITKDYVQWKMECDGNSGKTLSDGKISYNGTSAKGEIKVLTQGMTMTTKLIGERTGACQ